MENFVAWVLATLAGALIGSFLPGYLRKKGENLATHEDIDKLVDQVSAVTTATKEIEAKITGELWDRQKRWELKRDLLLDGMKKTQAALDAVVKFRAVVAAGTLPQHESNPARMEAEFEASRALYDAANEFEQASLLIELVCGQELQEAMAAYNLFVRGLGKAISQGQTTAVAELTKEISTKRYSVLTALRNELSLTPMNRESSIQQH